MTCWVRPAKPTLLATLLTVSDGTSIARAEPGPAPGSSVVRELVRATRPRQWSKNLLVFAAPLLSGRFTEAGVLADAAVAFVAFTLAASGVYLVNDIRDVESDRAHPTKRLRPVAAGSLGARTAAWAGGALAAAALVVALLAGVDLVVVVAIYLTLSLLYCFVLKDEPVIDIAIIAAGFLLRAIAGGAAAGIELSQWFLLAASFGSLFMAAGKRYAEILLVAQGEPALRASLASYSPVLPALRLDRVRGAADHDLRSLGLRARREGGRELVVRRVDGAVRARGAPLRPGRRPGHGRGARGAGPAGPDAGGVRALLVGAWSPSRCTPPESPQSSRLAQPQSP